MSITKQEAIKRLWKAGNLSYKLRGVQKEMREAVYQSKSKSTVFLASRRLGKSYTMCLIAIEHCLKDPKCIVKYLTPKKKDAKTIIQPIMRTILEDCPPEYMPEWMEADKVYKFPNGAQIQIGGTDNKSYESLRGGYANLAILDEAGFHDYQDFSYIVQSVIVPTLLTTKGKMILASTPSKESDHPFMVQYVNTTKADGTILEFDIYSNPLITEEDIEEIAREFPQGKEDPGFLREFMLKSDVASDSLVIPELNSDTEKDIVRYSEPPVHYDAYVAGDPAVRDLAGFLFAYYDFLRRKIVITDELVLGGESNLFVTTQDIADGITRKEGLHFRNKVTGELIKPYMRVMDNNYKILMNDLYQEHGLAFIPTQKDNKEAQINKVRMMINRGEIEIHPRCQTLLYHLKTTKWKMNQRTKLNDGFARVRGSSDNKYKAHHGDLVDALIYLVRNVDLNRNPFPEGYFELQGPDVFTVQKTSSHKDFMNKLMNIKKK